MNWKLINLIIQVIFIVAAIVMIFTTTNAMLWLLLTVLEVRVTLTDYKEYKQSKLETNE